MNKMHACKSLNLPSAEETGGQTARRAVSGIMVTLLLIAILSLACDLNSAKAREIIRYIDDAHARLASGSEESSFNGYTLFAPMQSTTTYLINNSGDIVQTWESDYNPRMSAYLLEDGRLLRTAYDSNPIFQGGGAAGRVQEIDWDGAVRWDFEYSSDQYCLHHDVEMLPNGNVLMIAWERKSVAEAIAAGRNPDLLDHGELWPDHILEVQPTGATDGNIIWQWHVWDHLIQDYDPTKENYGVVTDCPELVDINYVPNPSQAGADWNHMNSIDYNEEFDQILLSINVFREIWVIDHSTTTEEATSHTGGNSGRGGDILYRWGNPQTYRAGDADDQKFFHQHDAQWIEAGLPGEGNMLVFNNGLGRPGGLYSSVEEIAPPVDSGGNYSRTPGSPYGPEEPTWIYTAETPTDLFSPNISGAQRLPNGNTLICNGARGIFFEVTLEKETVWEYVNPFPNPIQNRVFKVRRYAPDYPGLTAWRADVTGDGIVDASDILAIAEAFGSRPEDPHWNPITDLVEDAVIDISDLAFVAESFGKTV